MRSMDGVRDLLTHLPSPSLFYEYLQSEIAKSERNGSLLHLLRFKLMTPDVFVAESDYEIDVINFSKTLLKVTRADDFVARLGKIEFIVIFHGESMEVNCLTERVEANMHLEYFSTLFSSVTFNKFEGMLSFLRRMEEAELQSLA
jgi:GGDEF domain-containing protein